MKYSTRPPRITRRGRFLFLVGFLLITLLGLGGYFMISQRIDNRQTVAVQKQQSARTEPSVTSHLLVVGDVFWGRSVQKKAAASPEGLTYLTKGLDPADRTTYDAWIGNFECPITSRDVDYSLQVSQLKFNCRPEYLPDLAKWFNAVTLANNHMDNNGGQQGLIETRQNLEKAGIQYTGNYDMKQTDDICEIVTLPAKRSDNSGKSYALVALCGYMQVVNVQPTAEQLAVMERYSRYMPVIALPHMGVEYRTTAEPEKVRAYRAMIDNGASMVIGAHPHVIQNSESWHGKLIVYSVGNFLFDQQSLGRDTTIGLGVDIRLTIPGELSKRYQEVAANCQAFKDSCLQRLEQGEIRQPITVSYQFRCFDNKSGVPVAGDEDTCASAKSRVTNEKLKDIDSRI